MMIKSYPFLTRLVVVIIVPVLFAVWYLIDALLLNSIPDTQRTYSLQWQEATVKLQRDEMGVALVHGQNMNSVHFAMGYAHAQDRLWQLELQRRISQGRLAELFGKSAVEQDVFFRTLGLYRAAQSAFDGLSDAAKASLTAYAAGVNQFLREGHTLPIEFNTFDLTPEPWSEIDSLAWVKVFALNLSGNYNAELQRLLVTKYLPEQFHETFFPDLKRNTAYLASSKRAELMSSDDIASLLQANVSLAYAWQIGGPAVGSNAWAVSAEHTESGQPLLASDPHLGLQLPSLWYAAVQQTSELSLSGMSLVGLPVIIFGRNQHIAWGGTNMQADVQDLHIETLKADDQSFYRSQGIWKPLKIRMEQINIRADFPAFLKQSIKPINLMVRETENGPIVSEQLGVSEVAISLRWSALDKEDLTYQSFFELNHASNWQSFQLALRNYKAPAMNLLYADFEGNIALQGVGALPVRRVGNGAFPSADIAYDDIWQGYVPFEQMPSILNPESGYVANANNHISGTGPHISEDVVDSARMERIDSILHKNIAQSKKLGFADMAAMQLDVVDLSTKKLAGVMAKVQPSTKKQAQAIALIQRWDGDTSEHSAATTVYHLWLKNIKSQLFSEQLSKVWSSENESDMLMSLAARVSADKVAEIITHDNPWCSVNDDTTKASCRAKVSEALAHAIDEASLLMGSDIAQWQWGAFQRVVYKHQPFSQVNGLKQWFERDYRAGGTGNTLNVSGSRYEEKQGYSKEFGAGFRQIIGFNAGQLEHRLAHAGGQSGQVMSPHYDDMLQSFERGEYIQLPIFELAGNK
ncbi:hypothetical protein C3B51_17490 [Pseudoalteromonas rubra]|uniref:Penicillin acylase family protein n=1 Tax=Pseudoalteromonas rubra TaxID=43658 RepID=A0A4Q7E475_9GAMM|nr:penicillin acylase family protein [Pseudoalteromonas rubra]RZM76721.1 hypothetical protein C3B51_17490 [Pseudoalteromonas rubra]